MQVLQISQQTFFDVVCEPKALHQHVSEVFVRALKATLTTKSLSRE